MPAPYTVGETVTLTAIVEDPSSHDEPFDPVGVTFKVLRPATTSWFTVTPTHSSPGVWFAEQVADTVGQWWWRVETSGPEGAAERTFTVLPSRFT